MDRDEENLTEEDKVCRGMEFLGLLSLLCAKKETGHDGSWEPLAKIEKEMYDSYIKVGFTPEQALRLSETKSNLIIAKILPSIDEIDPRFK